MNKTLTGLWVVAAMLVVAAFLVGRSKDSGEGALVAEVQAGRSILLDVRTEQEWSAGRAEKAVHFELARLEQGELPAIAKDSTIYIYCRSGSRAERAKEIFISKGFTKITNIGGLSDWEKLGGQIVK